jgi:transketolase
MEGVAHEAASIAGQNALGTLIYFYDDNRITIDGPTAVSFDAEDKAKRFEAYWLARPARRRPSRTSRPSKRRRATPSSEEERPSLVIVRSHIAYPAPNAIDTAAAHGAALGEEEVRAARRRWASTQPSTSPSSKRSTSTWTPRARPKARRGVAGALFGVVRRVFQLAEEWDGRGAASPSPATKRRSPPSIR